MPESRPLRRDADVLCKVAASKETLKSKTALRQSKDDDERGKQQKNITCDNVPLRPRAPAFFKVGRKMLAKTGPARPRTWRPLLLMENHRAAQDASFHGGLRRMLCARGMTTSLSETERFLFLRRDEGNGRALLGEVPLLS